MKALIFPTSDELARYAAASFVTRAASAIDARGRFSVALSGGSTPRIIFRQLADEAFARRVNWGAVHIFWSDERCVPPDHPDSNFRLARESLLSPLGVAESNIHRIEGELPPAEAAARYDARLRAFFGDAPPSFDLIHLGLGEDGHTASLFPGTAALAETEPKVVANDAPQLGATRITFTAPLINAARAVEFFVTGSAKARILREVLTGDDPKYRYPSQMIRPRPGTLAWLVTADAATQLPPELIRHA